MRYDLLLSTALAPPVSYLTLLYHHQGGIIGVEAWEHYVKQSYRNRCHILGPNGLQVLSIPVELPQGSKTQITEVRLSAHSDWRANWFQSLATAYGASPYYEYYCDELFALLEQPYLRLWDLNRDLLFWLCSQMELDLASLCSTTDFVPMASTVEDYRYSLRPKQGHTPKRFVPQPYYQLDRHGRGFVPDLSALDLLFHMGPEAPLILRSSYL